MLVHSIFFYFFSTIAVFGSMMVIFSKNTVHSVFFLILNFITISCLFIMVGAEFLGMIMLIVYVGAVAVLFLFVVMMLDVSIPRITKGFSEHLPFGLLIGIVIFLELIVVFGGLEYKESLITTPISNIDNNLSNTQSLGNIIYTEHIHLFQTSGMILLVAMIGAIVLTYRKKQGVKRQKVFNQITRERSESIELIDVESGKGVKLDD